jgi:hypothetical protein
MRDGGVARHLPLKVSGLLISKVIMKDKKVLDPACLPGIGEAIGRYIMMLSTGKEDEDKPNFSMTQSRRQSLLVWKTLFHFLTPSKSEHSVSVLNSSVHKQLCALVVYMLATHAVAKRICRPASDILCLQMGLFQPPTTIFICSSKRHLPRPSVIHRYHWSRLPLASS